MSYWMHNDTEVRTEPDGDAGFEVEIIHAKYIDKNLLAAAPDLLAALEAILPEFEMLYEEFDPDGQLGAWIEWSVMAQNAIAKAKGGEQ